MAGAVQGSRRGAHTEKHQSHEAAHEATTLWQQRGLWERTSMPTVISTDERPTAATTHSARGDVSFVGRKPVRMQAQGKYAALHELQPHPHTRFAQFIVS